MGAAGADFFLVAASLGRFLAKDLINRAFCWLFFSLDESGLALKDMFKSDMSILVRIGRAGFN